MRGCWTIEKKLNSILKAQELWLNNDPDGVRANPSLTDLAGVNLEGANLTKADLEGADLTQAAAVNVVTLDAPSKELLSMLSTKGITTAEEIEAAVNKIVAAIPSSLHSKYPENKYAAEQFFNTYYGCY